MTHWTDEARCKGMDVDEFFPDIRHPVTARNRQALRAALEVPLAACARCTVAEQCREYGLATKSEGVFGGVYLIAR